MTPVPPWTTPLMVFFTSARTVPKATSISNSSWGQLHLNASQLFSEHDADTTTRPFWESWTSPEQPAAPEYSYYYHQVTGALLVTWALLATMGNSVVIAVILRLRREAAFTARHVFILNLAVTHLSVSLFCTPLEAAFYVAGGRWPVGAAICKIHGYFHSVFVASAVFNLSNIAIERYYSVVYPLERRLTKLKKRLMITFTWMYALTTCIPRIFGLQVINDHLGRPVCRLDWPPWGMRASIVVASTLTILLPVSVTCIAYFLVWRGFRQSQRKVHVTNATQGALWQRSTSTDVRLLRTLLLLISSFVVLWTPQVVADFLIAFSSVPLPQHFRLTAVWMSRAQPVLDTLIYGYLNKQFHRRLWELVRGGGGGGGGGRGGAGGGGGGGGGGGWNTPLGVEPQASELVMATPNHLPPCGMDVSHSSGQSLFDSGFQQAPTKAKVEVPVITSMDGPTLHIRAHLPDGIYLNINDYVRLSDCRKQRQSQVTMRTVMAETRSPPEVLPDVSGVARRRRHRAKLRPNMWSELPSDRDESHPHATSSSWVVEEGSGRRRRHAPRDLHSAVPLHYADDDILQVERQEPVAMATDSPAGLGLGLGLRSPMEAFDFPGFIRSPSGCAANREIEAAGGPGYTAMGGRSCSFGASFPSTSASASPSLQRLPPIQSVPGTPPCPAFATSRRESRVFSIAASLSGSSSSQCAGVGDSAETTRKPVRKRNKILSKRLEAKALRLRNS